MKPLVQRNELDPKFLIAETIVALGDASAGNLICTGVAPAGFATLICRGAAWQTGSGGVTAGYWSRPMQDVSFYQGVEMFVQGTLSMATEFNVSREIDFNFTTTSSLAFVCDNTGVADDLNVAILMCLWEIEVVRQSPQNFFWPYTL